MSSYTQRLNVMAEGVENAQKLHDAGHLTKAALKRAIKKLKEECDHPGMSAGVGGGGAGAGGADSSGTAVEVTAVEATAVEAPKAERLPWPCSNQKDVLVAEEYPSYAQARAAVKKAFTDNTLYPELYPDVKKQTSARGKLPGGNGDPKRGYVDYEFQDGNGCRYHVHIMHISRSYHLHITFISLTSSQGHMHHSPFGGGGGQAARGEIWEGQGQAARRPVALGHHGAGSARLSGAHAHDMRMRMICA